MYAFVWSGKTEALAWVVCPDSWDYYLLTRDSSLSCEWMALYGSVLRIDFPFPLDFWPILKALEAVAGFPPQSLPGMPAG